MAVSSSSRPASFHPAPVPPGTPWPKSSLLRVLRAARKVAYSEDSPLPVGLMARRRRMEAMLSLMRVPPGAKVIDLGGTAYNWSVVENDLQVTLVNLPNVVEQVHVEGRFTHVQGDATDLRALFPDQSFDLVFSNSVIEHVGGEDRQRAFADEVRRLGRAYWIQTPSTRFPIEVHSSYPLYWQMRALLGKELVLDGNTWGIHRAKMVEMFPDGEVYVERLLGVEKSYTLYRPFPV